MSTSACPAVVSEAVAVACTTATCHWRCALVVIDELLSSPRDKVSGDEVDLLLDLRWQLSRRLEPETALRLFCALRIRMENRHYLAFFRIRRWLENHLVAAVRICPAATERVLPVKLDHYCVEAVRRHCLCACLGYGAIILAPKLRFGFTPVAVAPEPARVLAVA